MALASKVINQTGAIREFEKPEVCEAIEVANVNKWTVSLSPIEWNQREARLKKEYEKNTKAPGPGEEQPKENGLKAATDAFILQANEIMRLKKKNAELLEAIDKIKEGNPALNESASQFNDALLDEQAKEIERLKEEKTELLGMVERMKQDVKEVDSNFNAVNKENKRLNKKVLELTKDKSNLEDQITVLNACKKHNDKIDRKQIKCLGKEIAKLNGIIHDKNEELKRKTKGCCELIAENVDLKEHLADKVIDEINANALKSAESALAWKEKVVADLGKELKRLNALVNHISGKYDGAKINLKVRTEELERLKNELEEKTKLVEVVYKGSKEYCEYGIAAEKMIQKMAKVIVEERAIDSEDFEEYRRLAKGCKFNPQLPELSEKETAKILDFNAKCMRSARESINDVFESYAAKYAKSSLDDLKEKAYELFNAKAHNLGLVGSKDGNGLLYQMAGVDIAEEGGDQSATIVQCGNGITISKEEAEIIERCTKNSTELHYSEKDGFTYTNVFGEEMPIRCLRGMFYAFTDEEIENMKK